MTTVPNHAAVHAGIPVRVANVVPVPLDATQLFAGQRAVVIAHGRETYVLRLTRQNKLILTK